MPAGTLVAASPLGEAREASTGAIELTCAFVQIACDPATFPSCLPFGHSAPPVLIGFPLLRVWGESGGVRRLDEHGGVCADDVELDDEGLEERRRGCYEAAVHGGKRVEAGGDASIGGIGGMEVVGEVCETESEEYDNTGPVMLLASLLVDQRGYA